MQDERHMSVVNLAIAAAIEEKIQGNSCACMLLLLFYVIRSRVLRMRTAGALRIIWRHNEETESIRSVDKEKK
jgi:hypothetical protein